MPCHYPFRSFFLFIDTATTEIYTLSLHDALPISHDGSTCLQVALANPPASDNAYVRAQLTYMSARLTGPGAPLDRKSTRLNSSHSQISYAVFCLKKKKNIPYHHHKPRSSQARPPL